MNQINLLVIKLIICYIMIIILYKKYNKIGLYIYCSINIILTFIMSLKTVNMYDFDLNLGITSFVTIFTASNILIQKNGQEEVKRLLLTVIGSSLISFIVLYLTSFMTSSNINLFTSASYDNIFRESLRTFFAIFVAILYSLILNIKIYNYLKRIKNNIIIINLFLINIIQIIATILFSLINYIFTKEPIEIIKLIMIRYLVSLCVGILSTAVIYIASKIKE